MTAATVYIRSFFPLFLMGAIFGKLMETNGSAAAIAGSIAGFLGARRAILAVVLACAVLTYGGVSLFVVAFAVYPFASALFREADIPKRLIPGAIALGAFTLTMDALPGSPQIQNLIPTRFFGTDAYAAPVVGIVGGLLVLLGGLFWLDRRRAQAAAAGEGYGTGHRNEPEAGSSEGRPPLFVALLPLRLVLGANFVLSRTAWSVSTWYPDTLLHRDFPAVNVAASAPTWALIVALALGITAALAINPGRWKDRFSGAPHRRHVGGPARDLQHGVGGRIRQRRQDLARLLRDPGQRFSGEPSRPRGRGDRRQRPGRDHRIGLGGPVDRPGGDGRTLPGTGPRPRGSAPSCSIESRRWPPAVWTPCRTTAR